MTAITNQRRPGLRRFERRAFWLFVSPWLIGFALFIGGPILATSILSFTDYSISGVQWIGFDNYSELMSDSTFIKSIEVTVYYVLLSVPLTLVAALGCALLLRARLPGMRVFRTLFYLPTVVTGVIAAVLWMWLLSPSFGVVNYLLGIFGVDPLLWLQSSSLVVPAFAVMAVWALGGQMIIFLAALEGVPTDVQEAARVDGANARTTFLHITLPLISPAILFNLITGVIFSFQVFVPAQLITGGGPNFSSMLYVLYLYNNAFQYFRFGYASAMAWILFLVILALTIVVLWLSRRYVYYETVA